MSIESICLFFRPKINSVKVLFCRPTLFYLTGPKDLIGHSVVAELKGQYM